MTKPVANSRQGRPREDRFFDLCVPERPAPTEEAMTDKHKQRAEEIADGYVSADEVSRTYYTAGLVASIALALSEAVAQERERCIDWTYAVLRETEAERDELKRYADYFVNTCQIDHRQVAYTNADSEEWQECPVCEWKKKADEARATVGRVREYVEHAERWGNEGILIDVNGLLAALAGTKGKP